MGGENLRARRIEKQALASLDTETRWRDHGGHANKEEKQTRGRGRGRMRAREMMGCGFRILAALVGRNFTKSEN